jgi:hypothetical protein
MIGSTYAPVVIAIVVSIALAGWISAVYYANAHPRHRPKRDIKTEVAGGAFRAEHGGRQLMPIPGEGVHDIPAQRAATASDTYRVGEDLYSGGQGPADDLSDADAETRPLAGHPPR